MTTPRLTENQRHALERVRRIGSNGDWVAIHKVGQRASILRLIEKGVLEGDDLWSPTYVREMTK